MSYVRTPLMANNKKQGLTVSEALELQEWIVNPESRPYGIEEKDLIPGGMSVRSASISTGIPTNRVPEKRRLTVDELIELQQRIVNNL